MSGRNNESCQCEDTSLDPRMSVVRDLFKNIEESYDQIVNCESVKGGGYRWQFVQRINLQKVEETKEEQTGR